MRPIPIVIDTDPGVDDFFCLALACAYRDVLDLKAVCSMGGHEELINTFRDKLQAAYSSAAVAYEEAIL